ncbi:uncharacterized protein LOC126846457 isoform X1 [Adelges cooleyi]|uniref:uncharacterized protein LOC126846457 isoform X1 n=1 Tax=Adelges cooleyi TaxID=133065 RepID=UPI00217F6B4F|nr:uncharacterized protein LOC126846457 isoform X1 [Adelges cooleyi]XP_050441819.1 uncharacterized protein LOC126846457 isoform X1 [Adelges cooleyi]XP_050441820.1 uncharacterized protein LOC126846457 isoform X1 [Adelges cooleyi]XP_050441822.1 uncharacterized protein LOC126846457 isoform X1 [Adelges cooleyi]
MEVKLKSVNVEKLNSGMLSIINNFKACSEKIKLCEDNRLLYNEINYLIKLLPNQGEYFDYFTEILKIYEENNNEQSYYQKKMGISVNSIPTIVNLDISAKILQQTGIDDYNSNSLFMKYMSMIEKCNRQKLSIDVLDENIKKLRTAIEQQNDLKCELSNINYVPVGFTAETIKIKPINSLQDIQNCDNIIQLVKKISEMENNQVEISKKVLELSAEQKKQYRGLPPNMEQAMKAVQYAEKTMKTLSKKLVEKLENN